MDGPIASETDSDHLPSFPHKAAAQTYRTRTLLLFVILQCVLYGINLNLLPMWGDEAFTVVTVAETPARIIEIVRDDIHPPLYFLLAHWWNRLPIGSDPLLRLRALSVIFALLTTIFLDRLWLRTAPAGLRNWFLLFWVFSPCMLLFARMARSYSLQVLLTVVVVWFLLRFVESPTDGRNSAAFAVSLAALLYTHYLPGIAVWAGANFLLLRRRGGRVWKPWLLFNAFVAALFLPWAVTLIGALQQWEHSQVHNLTGNVWAEQLAKLGYCFYSFTFGESIPIWLLPVTLVLALPCLWLVVSGARVRRQWLWPGLLAAAVAYLGATRWVSTPFMGARLLFLLPLFLLALSAGVMARDRLGAALGMALVAANLVGLWAYFGARDILNLAYLTPNQRIAQEIVLHSRADDTVVWIDGLNFDETTLEYYLPGNIKVRSLTSPESVAAARAELDAANIQHVWFVRSLNDISPGQAFEKLESQMMETWPEEALHPYLPLSPTHVVILRGLAPLRHQDGSHARQYMYQMWEFRRPR